MYGLTMLSLLQTSKPGWYGYFAFDVLAAKWAQCVGYIAGKQARLVGMDGGIPGVLVCGY